MKKRNIFIIFFILIVTMPSLSKPNLSKNDSSFHVTAGRFSYKHYYRHYRLSLEKKEVNLAPHWNSVIRNIIRKKSIVISYNKIEHIKLRRRITIFIVYDNKELRINFNRKKNRARFLQQLERYLPEVLIKTEDV